jgi:hypothetical protein
VEEIMKSVFQLIICLVVVVPLLAFGQSYAIDQGSIILGGTASFQSLGGEDLRGDDRTSLFTLTPQFFYFVVPNFSVGAILNYQSISRGDFSDSAIGIGPTVVYFFGDESSNMYPFLGASYIYTSDEDSYTKNDFRLMGGSAFMIAKNVSITGDVFYLIESYKSDNADDSVSGNTFGVELGVTVFIF